MKTLISKGKFLSVIWYLGLYLTFQHPENKTRPRHTMTFSTGDSDNPRLFTHCHNTARKARNRDIPQQFERKDQGLPQYPQNPAQHLPYNRCFVNASWMEWALGSLQFKQAHSLGRIQKNKGFRMKKWQTLFICIHVLSLEPSLNHQAKDDDDNCLNSSCPAWQGPLPVSRWPQHDQVRVILLIYTCLSKCF